MSTNPKRDFTAKTARPIIDTSSLYGMEEVTPASSVSKEQPQALTTHLATPADSGHEWVQFSTYLHRNTYLRLKQAEYWEPGFVARQQIEQVVSDLLDRLEGANRNLPEEQYQRLLQKNKKLKP